MKTEQLKNPRPAVSTVLLNLTNGQVGSTLSNIKKFQPDEFSFHCQGRSPFINKWLKKFCKSLTGQGKLKSVQLPFCG